jgi:hypothetical protein
MEKLNGNNTSHSLSMDTRKNKRNVYTSRNDVGSAKIHKEIKVPIRKKFGLLSKKLSINSSFIFAMDKLELSK